LGGFEGRATKSPNTDFKSTICSGLNEFSFDFFDFFCFFFKIKKKKEKRKKKKKKEKRKKIIRKKIC
jgi:uncharacterized protein YutD